MVTTNPVTQRFRLIIPLTFLRCEVQTKCSKCAPEREGEAQTEGKSIFQSPEALSDEFPLAYSSDILKGIILLIIPLVLLLLWHDDTLEISVCQRNSQLLCIYNGGFVIVLRSFQEEGSGKSFWMKVRVMLFKGTIRAARCPRVQGDIFFYLRACITETYYRVDNILFKSLLSNLHLTM